MNTIRFFWCQGWIHRGLDKTKYLLCVLVQNKWFRSLELVVLVVLQMEGVEITLELIDISK